MNQPGTGITPARIVEEMVTRIVEHFHPQRVILFGSRARGEARADSDFDLLIIAPSDEPRWRRTVPIYRLLAGTGVPKDIVWWTPEEITEWHEVKSHFIHTVLREGKVLYERAA
jgi:predicted nucleotidyltransferase